jgi:acetylornithine/succinyldiaminopimelate/putrescine aminotransferase
VQHAARVVPLQEFRVVLRPIRSLGLFLGIEVVQVAEELIEAMIGRQVLVLVAEMILAELASGIAERLERLRNRDVTFCRPTGAPGVRTFDKPVRNAD